MKNEPPTHVLGLAHPPIPVVRIGFIGLGNRGLLTLERYMLIEHVEIKALCEIRPGNLAKGQALLTKAVLTKLMFLFGHRYSAKVVKENMNRSLSGEITLTLHN